MKPKTVKGSLRLEWIDVADLEANPANPRRHPVRQRKALEAVLKDVGWAGALLYNEQTGRLIDGHLRKEVMKPGQKVPVLVGSWTEEQEKEILATLDPLAGMANFDPEALEALMSEVKVNSEDLTEMLKDFNIAGLDSWLERPQWVPLEKVRPGPYSITAMTQAQQQALDKSIERFGIQEPLVVWRCNGEYEVVDGNQRYYSAVRLKLTRLPVKVVDANQKDALLLSMTLNKLRGLPVQGRIAELIEKAKEGEGDLEALRAAMGMEKGGVEAYKWGDRTGYEVKDGLVTRTPRSMEAGSQPVPTSVLFAVALPAEDYKTLTEHLSKVDTDWAVAIMKVVNEWATTKQ